ncbi:MAG: hypothetical protein ED557_09855 [Balneola sp.]|nr:MAG: hypothetical protein ED557_09855 [Balneola sp.]
MNAQNPSYKSTMLIALGAASILLIPLIAMFFTEEVDWGLVDFLIAWIMLFGTGITYKLISLKMSQSVQYKIATGLAVVGLLLIVWVNLAVGIIGNEENPVNLIFYAVHVVGTLGTFISRFDATGMSYTAYAMSVTMVIIGLITLIAGWGFVPILTAFFGILFLISGMLYRKAAE